MPKSLEPAQRQTIWPRFASGFAPLLALVFAEAVGACDKGSPKAGADDGGAVLLGPRAEPSGTPTAAGAAHGWNDALIDWQPYEAGLARAKAQHKPILLVLYANWCPHCKNYSRVFDDPRVVERARDFVMVRVDADDERGPVTAPAIDGGYVPRTFFLGSDGVVDPEIHAERERFRYFYDERDPSSLLAGMAAAAKRFSK